MNKMTGKARILVVEDERIIALDLQRLLIDLGYEVPALASSGEAGIRAVEETRPDLVLMDIRLRGAMDGVEAAEQIRTRYRIPVVYLTAYADETTLQRAKITEPFGYLLKPFEGRELHTTIEVALYKHQAERALQRHNRELIMLNQIIAASATSVEPETVLVISCRELALALDASRVSAALLDDEKTAARIVAESSPCAEDRSPFEFNRTISLADAPWFQSLLDHKAPVVVDGVPSLTIVPIIINQEVVGALILEARELRGFPTDEINLVRSVSAQVAGSLARVRLNTERQRLGEAIEQTADGVMITDVQGAIVYINLAFERLTGYTQADVVGRNPRLLQSGQHDAAFYQELWATITAGQVWHGRLTNKRKDGTFYTADMTITPVRDAQGGIVNYVGLQRDVTRELQLEEQYRQAQKMQAIGQLTAGIAHDFNNLLTSITGYTELMQFQLSPDDPLRDLLDRILRSGWRAAELVSQLLAFSRKQVIRPEVVDLNALATEMSDLLQPVIGEHIRLQTRLSPGLWPVKIDQAQFHQVVVNLAVNARDAMPYGGVLRIETSNVVLDDAYVARSLETPPGDYVLLAVSDTGVGMSSEVKAHLFEPFFTTKEVGQGTGLGLATVYGIVKQNGGHIWVYSEEGQGSTFKIYLPRTQEARPALTHPRAEVNMPSGSETILLVEDDERVRDLVLRILRPQGYTLLEARDGQDALQQAADHAGHIHLLLTDVVMPGLNGQLLSRQLSKLRPGLKVLFTSGYTDDMIAHHGVLDPGVAFLEKPFSPIVLARKVREVLDAG
jgi:PAS domain S-box-containing protein